MDTLPASLPTTAPRSTFDWLVDPESEPKAMLAFHYLEAEPRFSAMKWRLQKSGARIPDGVASALEVEVRQIATGEYLLPTEVTDGKLLTEGAKQTITVDARERNTQARRQAIARHGVRCSVCGFTFGDYYGEIGAGYIEVHHLHPLADAEGECPVDPDADLRPVCPNCHAILHLRTTTPREIEEVQERIEAQVAAGRVSFSWRRGG